MQTKRRLQTFLSPWNILPFCVLLLLLWQLASRNANLGWQSRRPAAPPIGPGPGPGRTPPIGSGTVYPMNLTCDGRPDLFYNGTCSPAFCSVAKDYTTPACTFTSTPVSFTEAAAEVGRVRCQTCTQAADARCSTVKLTALFSNYPGIFAAYCNDNYFVIWADGSTGSAPNLDAVPLPPGGTTSAGTLCRTRMASYVYTTANGADGTGRPAATKFKLCPTLLSTSLATNNLEAFPDGAKDTARGYLYNADFSPPAVYGLPSGGAVGTTIAGQQIYPTFNNRALYTPENCEVDHCNQHVGQGGGYPHTHGDSFGTGCLYSAANYSSEDAHPPHIGWSFDGLNIYGRYLSTAAPGYASAPLDSCGGHEHGEYGYHYHAQLMTMTTTGKGAHNVVAGQEYAGSTVGPHMCWKANISADSLFWASTQADKDRGNSPCCGAKHWYVRSGITLNGMGTQSYETLTSSSCPTTAATPTPSPTRSPSPSPSPSPTASTSRSPSRTPTASNTASKTGTPSRSPTRSPSRSGTPSRTASTTHTATKGTSPSRTPSGTPSRSATATTTASRTPSASPSTQRVAVAAVALTLSPAQPAAVVLASGVTLSLRSALAAAAGVSVSSVIVSSITYEPTGEVYTPGVADAVNTATRLRLLEGEEEGMLRLLRRALTATTTATNGTIIALVVVLPPSAPASQVSSVSTQVAAVVAGSNTAMTTSLASVAASWGTVCGTQPQAVAVAAATVPPAAAAANTISDAPALESGPAGGIAAAVLIVVIVVVAVALCRCCNRRRSAEVAAADGAYPTKAGDGNFADSNPVIVQTNTAVVHSKQVPSA